jgi:hypothetical protein
MVRCEPFARTEPRGRATAVEGKLHPHPSRVTSGLNPGVLHCTLPASPLIRRCAPPSPRWGRRVSTEPPRPRPPLAGKGARRADEGVCREPQFIPLFPGPKTSRILPPSLRVGGLQANSGGVSRAWLLPVAQVRVRPQRGERPRCAIPGCSKNRHPEAVSVSLFITYEAKAVSGSALALPSLACAFDNRIAGGASARRHAPPSFAAFSLDTLIRMI